MWATNERDERGNEWVLPYRKYSTGVFKEQGGGVYGMFTRLFARGHARIQARCAGLDSRTRTGHDRSWETNHERRIGTTCFACMACK